MSVVHTWAWEGLDRDADTGLIVAVHWRLKSVLGEDTRGAYGALTLPEPVDIAPEAVDAAQVKAWVDEFATDDGTPLDREAILEAELARIADAPRIETITPADLT